MWPHKSSHIGHSIPTISDEEHIPHWLPPRACFRVRIIIKCSAWMQSYERWTVPAGLPDNRDQLSQVFLHKMLANTLHFKEAIKVAVISSFCSTASQIQTRHRPFPSSRLFKGVSSCFGALQAEPKRAGTLRSGGGSNNTNAKTAHSAPPLKQCLPSLH